MIRCGPRHPIGASRMGHQPTGKSFAVEHIHIYRLDGDRIAEH